MGNPLVLTCMVWKTRALLYRKGKTLNVILNVMPLELPDSLHVQMIPRSVARACLAFSYTFPTLLSAQDFHVLSQPSDMSCFHFIFSP